MICEDRSTNNVIILSTDAGRTDGRMDRRTDGLRDFIFCPMHCIALDRQQRKTEIQYAGKG